MSRIDVFMGSGLFCILFSLKKKFFFSHLRFFFCLRFFSSFSSRGFGLLLALTAFFSFYLQHVVERKK